MKINFKRIFQIGIAFATCTLLWQVYNWYMPLFLRDIFDRFSGNEILVGVIMGLDNLVALFMIPFMSRLSDNCKSRFGKRKPFVIIGILSSALVFFLLPFINSIGKAFLLIPNIVLVLLCMNIYRSPVLALMPDITPKVHRNKANSIINIFGGCGIAIGYLLIVLFYDRDDLTALSNYIPFIVVTLIMVVISIMMMVSFNEPKIVQNYRNNLIANNINPDEEVKEELTTKDNGKVITNRRNVLLVLLVVFFVYCANNAVETWLSAYSKDMFDSSLTFNLFGLSLNMDSIPMACFGIGTFAFALPAALIADKMGRKNTILLGSILMGISYIVMSIISLTVKFSYVIIPVFIIGGAGFALVNINTYPMIIANCSNKELGKYTGRYYTASMLGQTITPALSGLLISDFMAGMPALFPYSSVFMILAVITLLFVKEA